MTHLAVPRSLRLVVLGLTIVAVIAACSGGAAGPAGAEGDTARLGAVNPAPAASAASAQDNQYDQSGSGSQAGSGKNPPNAINRPDLLIIKTGQLSLEVDGIDAALATATGKISALGGYVSGSDRKGDGDQLVATVTYRIPASQWDEALVALRGLATKVLGEQTQTQDVTGDVVDLGARITNLQATEAALQAIMARATKISDVLEVQAQLTDVRGQIEQLSTQRKHLQEQASYSTLTVSYSLKAQAAVLVSQKKFDPNDEIDKASASLVDVFQGLATAGIWFGIVWLPILLGLGVIAFIAIVLFRRFLPARRPEAGPTASLPTTTEGQP
jgi:hypothetical protein